jgi:hypothetical protein
MDSVTVTRFIAVPSAFLLGGYHFALSHSSVPALYGQDAVFAIPAFSRIYFKALQQLFLPTAATGLMSFGYLTYTSRRERAKLQKSYHRRTTIPTPVLHAVAAGLILGIGVITKVVMLPGIERLLEINQNTDLLFQSGTSQEVERLLHSFVSQNWWRAAFGMAAGFLGLYAVSSSNGEEDNDVSIV